MRTFFIIAALVCLGVSPSVSTHRIGVGIGGNPHDREVSGPASRVESLRSLIGEAQDLVPSACPLVS